MHIMTIFSHLLSRLYFESISNYQDGSLKGTGLEFQPNDLGSNRDAVAELITR